MKLAVMQPYFMPYLGYFQAIAVVDKYILYDQLSFILGGWINRNRILQRNMCPSFIVVPLMHKSSNELIANTFIDNSKPWVKKILKSLQLCYCKAEYFNDVMPLIEELLSPTFETISQLNASTIKGICKYLDISTEIDTDLSRFAEMEQGLKLVENGCYDAFPYMELTKPIKKVARAIALCKQEGTCEFINAIGGVNLYDKEELRRYGINIQFIKMNESVLYNQKTKNNSFIPNLSIIDVLMNNGKDGTKELLKEYTLI